MELSSRTFLSKKLTFAGITLTAIKNTQVMKCLTPVLPAVLIVFFLFISASYLSEETACIIALFNAIFAPLIFSLSANLTRKAFMLIIGNCIGVSWNYLFSLFISTGAYYFGDSFNILGIIINPFLNIIWIISFWSITLTFASPNQKTNRENNDN